MEFIRVRLVEEKVESSISGDPDTLAAILLCAMIGNHQLAEIINLASEIYTDKVLKRANLN